MECIWGLIIVGIMLIIVASLGNSIKNNTNGDGTVNYTNPHSSSNGIWLPLRERRRIRRFFKR